MISELRSVGESTNPWVVLAMALLWLLEPALLAQAVRVCEDEDTSVLSDGTVRTQRFRAVEDRTAGGVLAGQPPEGPERPNKMLLLLDYSGSMFGGYGKARVENCGRCSAGLTAEGKPTRGPQDQRQPYYYETPEFLALLADWIDAATPPGLPIDLEILLFNAELWRLGATGVESAESEIPMRFPFPVSTASSEQIEEELRRITSSPREVDSEAANTTESSKALATVVEAVEGEAIIWFVTDNIVDSGSRVVSAQDARRNLEFYELLKNEPRLQMVSAYPLSVADPCSWMCGTSLFIYGMYVSRFERPEYAEFHRLGGTEPRGGGPTEHGLLWSRDLQAVAARYSGRAGELEVGELSGVPLRLKPVDTEVLTLEFDLHRRQALDCSRSRAQFGDEVLCRMRARVRNSLRHQRVRSAELTLSNAVMLPRKSGDRQRLPWASAVCAEQMEVLAWRTEGEAKGQESKSIVLGPLAPLEEVVVEMVVRLPSIEVTTTRSHLLEVALTDEILLDGRILAELRDIQTELSVDVDGLEGVYGASELPEIFKGRRQSRILAEYPAGARVGNDGQALALIAVAVVGGGLLLATLFFLRFQRVHISLWVDGVERGRASLPRLSLSQVRLGEGLTVTLRRGWSRTCRILSRPGQKVIRDGSGWRLVARRGEGERYVEIRPRGKASRTREEPRRVQGDDL